MAVADTKTLPDLERRRLAILRTRKKFEGRPHRFGINDCAQVGAAHVRHMGHRKALGLAKGGAYKNAAGALKALRKAGFEDLTGALVAAGFVEIAPAAALPGDLLVAAGSHGLDAVGVLIASNTVLGFHEDAMAAGVQVLRIADLSDTRAFRL